jgi:signal transduction histidine kinase
VTRRLILIVMTSVTVAVAILSGVMFVVLSGHLEGAADAVLSTRADAVIATLSVRAGHLGIADTPDDGVLDSGVWVFDAQHHPVVRSRASTRVEDAVVAAASTGTGVTQDLGRSRILARPFLIDGVTGTVVVALSRLPFEQTERDTLLGMLLLGVLVLVVTCIGSWWLVRATLAPVRRMTREAREWSEHDPEQRFHLGPVRDEFTALGATLDLLLGRVSAALGREQRLTAEIAHELRTPLSRARLSAEMALRRPRTPIELQSALSTVLVELETTSHAVDSLLQASRDRPGSRDNECDPRSAVRAAVDVAQRRPEAGRLRWSVVAPAVVARAACDERLLSQIMAPLLQNAITYGTTWVSVEVREDGPDVLVEVRDDGPGLSEDEIGSLLHPGVRGDAAVGTVGFGLGLALATRLAHAANGDIRLLPGPGGRVDVRIPGVGDPGYAGSETEGG